MLVPKLRFKREDGTDYPEWEKGHLGDISEKVDRRASDNSTAPIMMISQGNGFIYQAEKYSRDNAGQSLSKYTLLKKGEMAYNHGASKLKPYGVAYTLIEENEARIPFVYHSFSLRKGVSSYWNYALNTTKMDRQLKKMVSSGARMDGLLNISFDTYMQTCISIPHIEEQQKIANFLSNVDEVIAQSEAEVANLQQQKKAAMQKIFSQEVRFKREDGTSYPEWEEKKLGAIGKAIIGSGFSKKYQGHKDLPIPFYKVSDMNNVGNEIVMNNSNNYVSEELLLKMGLKACQQNAIIFAKVGAALMLDRKRIANKPFLVDNNMMIFMPNENNELRYIYHWLTSIRLSKYAQIGALPSFNASDIEYVVIPLPCLEEQQKIADFLATYDEAISCAKQELDKWKELKKGLLQQMFA